MFRCNPCLSLALSALVILSAARCAPTSNPAMHDPTISDARAAAAPATGSPSKLTLDGMQAYNNGDRIRAFRYLKQAADAGDAEAQANLGYLYTRGHGTSVNPAEAMRLYELSAKGGSSEGMNAIGFRYLHGSGVPKDPAKAAQWFCEALQRGNPRAMNNLAIMLTSGDLPFDEEEARSLWQQAAALGHANAMTNLAHSYSTGQTRDAQQAEAWMLRAAQAGHGDAQRYVRSRGYSGALPAMVDVTLRMTPTPVNATGHSKQCGAAS